MGDGEGDAPRYWAFISYSHADKQWGDWLHHSLETYRVPKRLVGKASRDGVVPRRIFPVFRDREELPGSSNLGDNINSALADSRYLIVICSPRAAVSRWVNEEIKTFKALGREDRVLCLIVDGEPNATSKPELGLLECFPEAVRFRIGPDRQITDEPTEPIAADARPDKDGKTNAKLKLLSGVLGVAYDELKQRDRQRWIRRRIQIALGTLLLLGIIGAVFGWKETQQRAQQRRAQAEAEFATGLKLLERGESAHALAWFARALRHDPTNQLLVSRATSLVTQRSWTLPAAPPMTHGGAVAAAEWNSGGTRVATAGADGSIRIWDAATAKPLSDPLAHKKPSSVAWSPDGSRLATAGDPQGIVWDAESGKQIASGLSFIGAPQIVRFSPDGSAIATASADGSAVIWSAAGERRFVLPHPGPVFFSTWSPNGARLLTAALDETARLWDVSTGLPAVEPIKLKGFPFGADFSPDGTRFVTASESVAEVWDAGTGERLFTVQHEAGVLCARWSPDGKHLLTGSIDRTARLWDATSGAPIGEPLQHGAPVQFVTFSASGDLLVTGTTEAEGQLWETKTGQRKGEPFRHRDRLQALSFAPASERVLTASNDGTAQVWNVAARPSAPLIMQAAETIAEATFEADGKEIHTVSSSGAKQIWDANSGQLLRSTTGPPPPPAVSGDGTRRAMLDDRKMRITVLDARTNQAAGPAITAPTPAMTLALNSNGDRVCGALADSAVHCWNVATGASLFPPIRHPELVRAIDFSADDSRLATASMDRAARIFDATTGAALSEPLWHSGAVQAVHFGRDGKQLATATLDGKAMIWSTGAQLPMSEPFSHDKPGVRVARLSPDGRWLLTVNADRAFVWDTVRLPAPAPEWLPDALEAIGGFRIADNNLPEPVQQRAETIAQLRSRTADANEDEPFDRWAWWLFANDEQRTLSPFSKVQAPPAERPAVPRITPVAIYPNALPPEAQRRALLVSWLQHGSFWLATVREARAPASEEAQRAAAVPLQSFDEALKLARELVTSSPESVQAQRDLSDTLFALAAANLFAGRAEKALALSRDAVAAAEAAARLRPDDGETRAFTARALGSLAGILLYNRQPAEAREMALRALEQDPREIWINVNLALAYLLGGEYAKAEPIYLANKDVELTGFREKTFGALALKTLDELKAHGIEPSDAARVRALLQPPAAP